MRLGGLGGQNKNSKIFIGNNLENNPRGLEPKLMTIMNDGEKVDSSFESEVEQSSDKHQDKDSINVPILKIILYTRHGYLLWESKKNHGFL